MSIIHKLPQEIVEKIAAGEVVERPSSIVKELLENAMDAGASKITVNLENGGIDKIQIIDNGSGMSKEDLLLSIERHATSKITSLNDLFSIHTLGFRGEALASMCAVSTLTIKTAQAEAEHGYQLVSDPQTAPVITPVATPVGTTVTITNLFANVPARKKFLKTTKAELDIILDVVTGYCLSRTDVHFVCTHNGSSIIDSPPVNDVKEKVSHMYGSAVAKSLRTLAAPGITGYISDPFTTRSDKEGMHFFLNGRLIKNPNLVTAVSDGYGHSLMSRRLPYAFLFLRVHPESVDVNVHPAKHLVKFENEGHLLDLITTAVKSIIQTDELHSVDTDIAKPLFVKEDVAQYTTQVIEPNQIKQIDYPTDAQIHYSAQPKIMQQPLNARVEPAGESQPKIHAINQAVLRSTPSHIEIDNTSYRYIGQIHKTYAILESKKGLVMIDFHAAHERYLYEIYMDQFFEKKMDIQQLVSPQIMQLTPKQYSLYTQYAPMLADLGFDIDVFGPNTIKISKIPMIVKKLASNDLLLDLLDGTLALHKQVHALDDLKDRVITRMACRAADKAGDELSDERMKQLIRWISLAKFKYQCPHGRPTMIELSEYELDKLFKRKV